MLLEELKELISHDRSYVVYRDALTTGDPPMIPYIGLFLSDLTFISEMPNLDDDGKINFEKNYLVGNVISVFNRAKEMKHNYISVNSLREYIKYSRANLFTEDIQYKISHYFSGSEKSVPLELLNYNDIDPNDLLEYFEAITSNASISSEFQSFLSRSFNVEELKLYKELKNYKESLYKSTIPEESMEIMINYMGYGGAPWKLTVISKSHAVAQKTLENVLAVQGKIPIGMLERNSFDDLYQLLADFLMLEWIKFCGNAKRKCFTPRPKSTRAGLTGEMEDVLRNPELFQRFHDFLLERFSHEYLEFWRDVEELNANFTVEETTTIAEKWLGFPKNDPLISFTHEQDVKDVLQKLKCGNIHEHIYDVLIDDCKENLLSKWSEFNLNQRTNSKKKDKKKKEKKKKKGSLKK